MLAGSAVVAAVMAVVGLAGVVPRVEGPAGWAAIEVALAVAVVCCDVTAR